MLGKRLWWMVCAMLVVSGCGAKNGGAAPPSTAENVRVVDGASAPAGSSADVQRLGGASEAPGFAPPRSVSPPAASPEASSAPKEAAEPSQNRPGLGTEWGEARTSRVHDVSFVRDGGRPFAIAQFNYNDRKGVEALVSSHRDSSRELATGGGAVTVALRDANGDSLEAFHAGDRTFVVGQAGQRYSIVLTNHSSHRFEAVATVDGLDVVNGKEGSFDNRGYVLLPFATLQIDGFRQSAASVATFRFASVGESYAAQVGKARNVGVIGVAFFSERGDSFVPDGETRLRDTASPFPSDSRFAPPPPPR